MSQLNEGDIRTHRRDLGVVGVGLGARARLRYIFSKRANIVIKIDIICEDSCANHRKNLMPPNANLLPLIFHFSSQFTRTLNSWGFTENSILYFTMAPWHQFICSPREKQIKLLCFSLANMIMCECECGATCAAPYEACVFRKAVSSSERWSLEKCGRWAAVGTASIQIRTDMYTNYSLVFMRHSSGHKTQPSSPNLIEANVQKLTISGTHCFLFGGDEETIYRFLFAQCVVQMSCFRIPGLTVSMHADIGRNVCVFYLPSSFSLHAICILLCTLSYHISVHLKIILFEWENRNRSIYDVQFGNAFWRNRRNS